MRTTALLFAGLAAVALSPLAGANPPALSGCEAPPEIRQTILDKLSDDKLDKLPRSEAIALRREVLESLIAKYPREVEPQRLLIQWTFWYDKDHYTELVERYRRLVEQHPDDPLALDLAGQVLASPDPEQSVRYLERAKTLAPGSPWPPLELAHAYASGRMADKTKAAENITAFFSLCPAPGDENIYRLLPQAGSPALEKHVAAALRTRLAGETDPRLLGAYQTLWGLDFRTHPVQEHDQVRQQVAKDVARLEALWSSGGKPESLLSLIHEGYKQIGSPEKLAANEDWILRVSHGETAFEILFGRWIKAHPDPEDVDDRAAWAKHDAEYIAELHQMTREFPGEDTFADRRLYFALQNVAGLSEAQGIAAMNAFFAEGSRYGEIDEYDYDDMAEFLLDRGWEPQKALEYAQSAIDVADRNRRRDDALDRNLSAEDLKKRPDRHLREDEMMDGDLLRAALAAGTPDAVRKIRASVEAPPPQNVKLESDYWLNRARLALLDGRQVDALEYYQKALHTRGQAPKPWHARVTDHLTDEAHALWTRMGGTESAWLLWSRPPANRPAELAEGRWEKPSKTMPGFELTDLQGKTWRLRNLEGKAVLVNVWATWCGPCNVELPKLEKLYAQTKDSPKFQIVTFNVDEDPGLVAPFMKAKGFTFPVLFAHDLVDQILDDSVAIPQNWVLDNNGVWRWSQIGFNAGDSKWADDVLEKLGGGVGPAVVPNEPEPALSSK